MTRAAIKPRSARPSQGRATAGARRPAGRVLRAELREERVSGFTGDAASRVDRTQPGLIIIRGVKVVGKRSPNRHGIQGAENGTEYLDSALQESLPLYENLLVNIDHPPRLNPNQDRGSRERLGKLVKARVVEGETYADLVMLESVEMANVIANAAEAMPEAFALSHNARGVGEVVNGVYVIREIPEVRSVDVVSYGGTNTSLFEGKETKMKTKTLRKLLRESAMDGECKKKLLEMGDEYAPDMMDADEPAAEGVGDHKDDLVEAIKKLVASEAPEDHALAEKIMKLMKPDTGEQAAPVEEDDDDGVKGDSAVKESRELKAEVKSLKDDLAVRDLCESMQFSPSATTRKALLALGNEKDRKAMIGELRGNRSAPRSGSPGRPVQESRNDALPKEAKDRRAALLR
jgi:hypothetical protein